MHTRLCFQVLILFQVVGFMSSCISNETENKKASTEPGSKGHQYKLNDTRI